MIWSEVEGNETDWSAGVEGNEMEWSGVQWSAV